MGKGKDKFFCSTFPMNLAFIFKWISLSQPILALFFIIFKTAIILQNSFRYSQRKLSYKIAIGLKITHS
jgi:hypothetical protein